MSSARARPRPYHCSSSLWGPLSADHMSPPSMNSSTSMGGLTQNPAHAHHVSEAQTSLAPCRLLVDLHPSIQSTQSSHAGLSQDV